MKQRLNDLNVSDLISLMEGNTDILLDEGEKASEVSLAISARNILYEYREIVDPSGMKTFLMESEELIKAKISHLLFSICLKLLSFGFVDETASILDELGINGAKLDEKRMKAVVKSNLERSKATIAEIEKSRLEETSRNVDIHRHFDEQTVAMMAHFKYQIDTSQMKASIYAHLVARFSREVKMLSAAMKKRRS